MRVLFVSGIDGFCHRYQVLHRAAQVCARGGGATVRHHADPRLAQEVAAHDVLLLYRVPATEHVRATVAAARSRGVPAIGAIDDLVFVDEPRLLPRLEHLSPSERELWRRGVRRYRATLSWCDAFLGPTEPLVEVARSLGWDAHLHRNALAPAELELGRRARAAASRRADDGVVLGYFSGTPTHDEDFASIATPVAELLRADPRVRLLVVGPLALPPALHAFEERVERRGLVPWHLLPELVARVDVSLAPLAPRPFAEAKGEVKYLEAAAVGVPVIASATSAYRHAIRDGRNGRLARNPGEWRAALAELTADPALRARLGDAASADVRARWTEDVRAAELAVLIEEVVRRGVRRSQEPLPAAADDAILSEPCARRALEADACPALPSGQVDVADVSPPLGDGLHIAQRFRPTADGLVRVDVHAVTYGQRLDHELTLTLRRDDGTVASSARLAAGDAPDRGWLALDCDRVERRSAGRVYQLEIAARGAGPCNALSLGLAAASAGDGADDAQRGAAGGALGAALLGETRLAGPLALRAFARWPEALGVAAPADAASGVAPRVVDGGAERPQA